MSNLRIDIFVGVSPVYSGGLDRPLELGRENDDDGGRVYQSRPVSGGDRVAIAGKELVAMSRQLMLLAPLNEDRIQITSLTPTNVIHVGEEEPLWPKQQRTLSLPAVLTVVDRRIELTRQDASSREMPYQSMDQPMLPLDSEEGSFEEGVSGSFPLVGNLSSKEGDKLLAWLGVVTRVLQSAIGSVGFFDRAAKEMVDLIGLDSGRVLVIMEDGRWTVAAEYHRPGMRRERTASWLPITSLIRRVIETKTTSWNAPDGNLAGTMGTPDVTMAVAAPILDRTDKVIGALYGDRHMTGSRAGESIGPLEGLLVETLARGVSLGRARVDQERAAAEAQVRFEQFFTPELSRQLAANPNLLTHRDTEVTLLFADIRRFSGISEERGAEVTMKWLKDVMGTMADCAAKYSGTLVDYIGDELMVMWNAPAEQDDHATRACQTALEMAREMRDLDLKWERELGHRTRLGFGINTGTARVGNVGFERKFRYAPFGNTVNAASRVQGATKYLGVDVIATETAFNQLKSKVVSRRLCSTRVVNIEAPIMLYELCANETAEVKSLCERYEDALHCFETDKLPQSINILSAILQDHPTDGPTLLLLSRAVEYLLNRDKPFDPVFELPGK